MPMTLEKDLTERFKQAFVRLPAVSSVEVHRKKSDYTVDITVTDFDRSVRDPIYRRQQELINKGKARGSRASAFATTPSR